MGEKSKIEWTDSTWTPIRARNLETGRVGHFCIHKSPGCKFCYSEIMQRRFGNPIRFAAQDAGKVELFLDEKMLAKPLSWRKPRMVFVCSMTDLFLEHFPDAWIDKVFAVMALSPSHTFQVLTKRPERMAEYVRADRREEIAYQAKWLWEEGDQIIYSHAEWPLPNVWLGTSIEGPAYWARAEHLKQTPATIRFLSIEPLIEGLGTHVRIVDDIDWVIVGGESGPKARPMHPQWAREIRDQCQAAGVPFFFKQWGAWLPGENSGWYSDEDRERGIAPHAVHQDGTRGLHPASSTAKNYVMWEPDGTLHEGHRTGADYFKVAAWATRVGKKRAGRLLDGREWNEMPA